MIGTIVRATVLQRSRSPVRILLVSMFFFFPLLALWISRDGDLEHLGDGYFFGLVLAAGIVGQDVSSGVLQLLFARPVTRARYAIGRWLGAASLGASIALLQVGCGALILAIVHTRPGTSALLARAGEAILSAFGAASIVLLFSTLVGGLGDLALLLLFGMFASALRFAGSALHQASAERAGVEVGRFLVPKLELGQLLTGGGFSWFEIVSYLSTVTLCLALAIVVLNRKEISYASSSG